MPARVCVLCRREPAQPPWEPFCSERCKLLDLAKWVGGDYRVPVESVSPEREQDDDDHT